MNQSTSLFNVMRSKSRSAHEPSRAQLEKSKIERTLNIDVFYRYSMFDTNSPGFSSLRSQTDEKNAGAGCDDRWTMPSLDPEL